MRGPRLRYVAIVVALAVLVGVGLAPRGGSGTRAQGAATPPAGAPAGAAPLSETLFQATLETLPRPPAFIRIVRITLQPGARVPAHTHPGPEFGRVESGTLTIETGGQAVFAQPGPDGAPQQPRVTPVDEPFPLPAGGQIVFPASVPFTFSNQGQEPAVFLAAVVLPAGSQRPPGAQWVDGTPGPSDLRGVSSLILGDAIASGWPTPPHTIVLDRLALAPGEPIPGRGGPVMLSVELGSFAFQLVEGDFQVSSGGTLPQTNATPGVAYILGPGDAVFFPGGISEVPRAEGEGVLVLLRLSVLPSRAPAAGTPTAETPAPAATQPAATQPAATQPAATQPPATTAPPVATQPAPTPAAPPADQPRFAVGATVTVTEPGVRLRDAPSTEGGVVAELEQGRQLTVTGAPQQGDDITWYPVEATDDPAVAGFIAEDFLAPAQ
jgi:mannose-6-phosphate isomerase-like protein (cupin superfamily)